MNQEIQPGELPLLPHNAFACVDNLRHNLLLRQQRGGGHGYLLDAEAEWLLQHVVDPTFRADEEALLAETGADEVEENSREWRGGHGRNLSPTSTTARR